MYKPSILCRFAICQRLLLAMLVWVALLIGLTDMRQAANQDSSAYEGIKRLALYSVALRSNR